MTALPNATADSHACTTAQLHSTKPELRFCTGSNPACSVSEIHDVEDLWQRSWLEIRLNAFCQSTIPQKQFITYHHHHHHSKLSRNHHRMFPETQWVITHITKRKWVRRNYSTCIYKNNIDIPYKKIKTNK